MPERHERRAVRFGALQPGDVRRQRERIEPDLTDCDPAMQRTVDEGLDLPSRNLRHDEETQAGIGGDQERAHAEQNPAATVQLHTGNSATAWPRPEMGPRSYGNPNSRSACSRSFVFCTF